MKAVRRVLTIIALSFSLLSVSFATEDPFNGDWKLDVSKLKTPAKGLVTQQLHIEGDETKVVIVHMGTNVAGEPMQWEVRTDFNGKLTGVVDSPEMDFVLCWRSDTRTIVLKLFQQSITTGFWTAEVSRNGKTLKVTSTAVDGAGKETKTVNSFDRQ